VRATKTSYSFTPVFHNLHVAGNTLPTGTFETRNRLSLVPDKDPRERQSEFVRFMTHYGG